MRFDIITIFPEVIEPYLDASILKRARERRVIDVRLLNIRDFAADKRGTVDDAPYGGGPGMVLKIEPLARAFDSILKNHKPQTTNHKQPKKRKNQKPKTKIILFSAGGKQFTAKMARDIAKKYDRVIMIAGHYEGIDERVKKVIKNWKLKIENLSVGPYVLTGGELPAMIVVDAVSRHISGVLGKSDSLEERRYGIGVPAYTRPETFRWRKKIYRVPRVLLSGDHKLIEQWRRQVNPVRELARDIKPRARNVEPHTHAILGCRR